MIHYFSCAFCILILAMTLNVKIFTTTTNKIINTENSMKDECKDDNNYCDYYNDGSISLSVLPDGAIKAPAQRALDRARRRFLRDAAPGYEASGSKALRPQHQGPPPMHHHH